MESPTQQTGFTLVEVLGSLAVVAVLLAVLLPAVQHSRESARRLECSSHLKQLGLGVAQYQSVHGVFPDALIWRYSLLPFIDAQALYAKRNPSGTTVATIMGAISEHGPATYRCPSDSAPEKAPSGQLIASRANYVGNFGTWVPANGFDGLFVPFLQNFWTNTPPARAIRPESVRKGLSHTSLGSEVLCANHQSSRMRTVWLLPIPPFINASDMNALESTCSSIPLDPASLGYVGINSSRGFPWYGGDLASVIFNHVANPNRPSCLNGGLHESASHPASSAHSGGVNV